MVPEYTRCSHINPLRSAAGVWNHFPRIPAGLSPRRDSKAKPSVTVGCSAGAAAAGTSETSCHLLSPAAQTRFQLRCLPLPYSSSVIIPHVNFWHWASAASEAVWGLPFPRPAPGLTPSASGRLWQQKLKLPVPEGQVNPEGGNGSWGN